MTRRDFLMRVGAGLAAAVAAPLIVRPAIRIGHTVRVRVPVRFYMDEQSWVTTESYRQLHNGNTMVRLADDTQQQALRAYTDAVAAHGR